MKHSLTLRWLLEPAVWIPGHLSADVVKEPIRLERPDSPGADRHLDQCQPIGGIPEWHGKATVESDGAGDVWELWSNDAAAELVIDARTGTIKIAGMNLSSGGVFDFRGEGVPPFDVKTI